MKRVINWGLVGLGNASLNLAREFDKLNNSKLFAVASLTESKRDYFTNKFKIEKTNVYSNYQDIFKNENIDVVYIGLPNSMHERFCLEALYNNKNVVVEKPLTNNFLSLKKIKKLFLEKELILEEGTANKFHPFYKKIMDNIKNQNYSKISSIKSSFGNDALGGKKIFGLRLKKINKNKRLFNKNLLGGAILDGGIYPISLIVDIINLFNNNFLDDIKIINCKKKIAEEVDLSSTLELSINNINIEIKTSLLDQLDNNLTMYLKDTTIILENVFNISTDTFIKIKEKKNEKIIKNDDEKNSYYYLIKEISDLLILNNHKKNRFRENFQKIEKNINLLSRWYSFN